MSTGGGASKQVKLCEGDGALRYARSDAEGNDLSLINAFKVKELSMLEQSSAMGKESNQEKLCNGILESG